MPISALRILGVVLGVAGIALLLRLRRERLLGRMELFLLIGLSAMVAVALVPGLADILPRLTGFTGALARIVSVLAFAVVGLTGAVVALQGEVGELRGRLYGWMRQSAVERALLAHAGAPTPGVCILMPAFNEAGNLPEVLALAPREVRGLPVQVVVVDDGSTDGTAQAAADGGAWVVANPVNTGGGHALHVGFLFAQRLGCPICVTMDADGQHRFEDLDAVVAPLAEGRADLTIGSRHLGEAVGGTAVRALGLKVFNALLSFLTGRRVTDCSSGMRGIAVGALGRLRLIQRRHHTDELIIEARRRGLKVEEVPITILPRISGESKKGADWIYGLRFFFTVLSSWWRR